MLTINKNTVQFNCSAIDTAGQLKNELADFMQYRFYPELDKIVEVYDTSAETWQIDKIPVSIEIANRKQWKNEFLHESLAQIRLFLRQQHKPTKSSAQKSTVQPEYISGQEVGKTDLELLVEFLLKGFTNDYKKSRILFENLKDFQSTNQEKNQILKAVVTEVHAMLRFVFSMPEEVRNKILGNRKLRYDLKAKKKGQHSVLSGKRSPQEFQDFLEVIYHTESLPKGLQENFAQLLITHFEVTTPEFEKWLDKQSEIVQTKFQDLVALFKGKTEPSEIFGEGDTFSGFEHHHQEPDVIESQEMYYISNGGLILLHPFLQNLFKKLDYLEDDQSNFKSKQKQNRAVLMTQYLINFEEPIFENDLVFNKVLCGVKITDAINTKIDFSEYERELCRDLLSSIISHWKILKNTSPESLQASFLQRDAKLQKAGNAWKLTVEKQGIDVLLSHLPWGIGTVKTPWMKNHLSCNWNG